MRLLKSILQIRFCVTTLLSLCLVLLHAGFSLSADLTLAWDANSEGNLAGYKIHYSAASPNGVLNGTGLAQGASPITIHLGALKTAASPSFRLSGLAAGESYHFAVTAYNKTGNESDYSNLVKYDVPMPVTHSLIDSTSGQGEGAVNVQDGLSKAFVTTSDAYHHIAMEVGEAKVNNNWKHVRYSRTFVHPVVVASVLSNNDDEPAVVRIDNITSTGFEISVQEWDYLDDDHLDETIGYIVMEAGSFTLPDGTAVEAGTYETNGSSSFEPIAFTGNFRRVPVVALSVASYNDPDAVTIRLQNISSTQFEYQIREQQANTDGHLPETVSYIAWEPCRTQLEGLSIEVANTKDIMAHDFKMIPFTTIFPVQPVFVASIQTNDGCDNAALRWEERSNSNIQVKVEEEQSFDLETRHTPEVVGFFAFAIDTTAGTD